jgi:nicotinamidase-related amidase
MKRERNSAGQPGPLGRFLIRGEPGQDIVADLAPEPGEPVFDKPGFSAFYRTGLQDHLRSHGITHLIVTGVTTQCCVHSTLRSAVDRGYWCLTLEDCCAAQEPALHEAALSLIYGEGHLFGWVCASPALLAALDI